MVNVGVKAIHHWSISTESSEGIHHLQKYRNSKLDYQGNFMLTDSSSILTNFYARTLMFYSNVSSDKNQGFDVNNDYRQSGIIKNPRQYGSTYALTTILASACWVIAGTISTTFFPADSIITVANTSKRFRIITNTGDSILAQSLDNYEPLIGTTFVGAGGQTFSATAVTAPKTDKYSGDLLFIDNKAGFTPTADQSVTLRTIIKF
jgi:hypothetical protein